MAFKKDFGLLGKLIKYCFCVVRLDEFMAGFNVISLKLKEMYQVFAFAETLNVHWFVYI